MQKIKLPKTVRVGGMDYKILFPYDFGEQPNNIGLHNGCSGIIRIAKNDNNQIVLETLLHELAHAVDNIYNRSLLDEDTVAIFARAWLQILIDNDIYLHSDKMPKKIKVAGFSYRVDFPYKFVESVDDLAAQTINNSLIIRVGAEDSGELYNQSFIKAVLVYSINSAVGWIYLGREEEPEPVTHVKSSNFAHGWYQVLKDNKIDSLVKIYGG